MDVSKFVKSVKSAKKYIEDNTLSEIEIGNIKYVVETKLSRLYQHSLNGFFMISAFRGSLSLEENMSRHLQLKNDLRSKNLGFIELVGTYIENLGKENEQKVKELSLFVPNSGYAGQEFFNIAVDLMNEYDQDGIVYKEKGSPIYAFDRNGDVVDEVGSFSPDKITVIFSTLRYGKNAGRTFTFEGYTRPSNSIHALALGRAGYII